MPIDVYPDLNEIMPPAIWEGITPQRINDVAYWHKADIAECAAYVRFRV